MDLLSEYYDFYNKLIKNPIYCEYDNINYENFNLLYYHFLDGCIQMMLVMYQNM
jgi:hypothetical protein